MCQFIVCELCEDVKDWQFVCFILFFFPSEAQIKQLFVSMLWSYRSKLLKVKSMKRNENEKI